MTQTLAQRYRRWFEYEKNSHARVIESLEAVPAERRSEPAFRKAVSLAAHVAAARQLWLFRMGYPAEAPTEFFPEGLSVDEVAARLDRVHALWTQALGDFDDAALDRVFEYRTLAGEPFKNTIADILTQLFGHSLYHRGQIALLLRQMGAEPVITDFVFWAREPIEAKESET